jgi:hypothetical protein
LWGGEKGPIHTPIKIESFKAFMDTFGGSNPLVSWRIRFMGFLILAVQSAWWLELPRPMKRAEQPQLH